MKRLLVFAFALASAFLLLGSVGFAADKSFRYKEWNVDVTVNENSTLDVIENYDEEITGEWNGRYRDLMYGDNVLGFSNILVEENGVPYKYMAVIKGSTSNTIGSYYYSDYKNLYGYTEVLWAIHAVDEERKFTLKYKVDGGFYYYDTADKLEWKAVSELRDQPIDSVKVTVHLPQPLDLKKDDIGLNADGTDLTMKQIDKTTVVYSGKDLGKNTRFWVGLRFPKGYLTVNPALLAQQQKNEEIATHVRWGMIASLAFSVMLVIAVFIGMLLIWYKFGREQEVPKTAEYLTAPPDAAPPAAVSMLLFEAVDVKDVNATLVDLARRGYIKFWDKPDDTLFEWKGDQGDMRTYEQQLIADLFEGQQTASLKSFKNKFYMKIPKIQKMMADEAVKMGFYSETPTAVRRKYYIAGGLTFVLAGLMACCTIGGLSDFFAGASETLVNIVTFSPPAAMVISALIIIIFGYLMPRKTVLGAQERENWWAFRNYLANIKKYGVAGNAQEIFEKYIPFAVAFQLESIFTSSFDAQEVVPPIWFMPWYFPGYPDHDWAQNRWGQDHPGEPMPTGEGGLAGFDLNKMSDSLTSTLNDVATTLTSAPSSSSSGGGGFSGGGGGFSGGGGGGGGSGGW